jgi:hypothetical protein
MAQPKWSDDDIRFEYSPTFSLVIFGKQLAIIFGHKEVDAYWSAWIYYSRYTDKSLSQEEKLIQCIKDFPLVYTRYSVGHPQQKINYYTDILKPEYLNLKTKKRDFVEPKHIIQKMAFEITNGRLTPEILSKNVGNNTRANAYNSFKRIQNFIDIEIDFKNMYELLKTYVILKIKDRGSIEAIKKAKYSPKTNKIVIKTFAFVR